MALRFLAAALLACPVLARTDLEGCTSYDSVVVPSVYGPYMTRIFYVPDIGEVCEPLDCGGGRAPPKKTVLGCAGYIGSGTYSPRFIDPKTLGGGGGERYGDAERDRGGVDFGRDQGPAVDQGVGVWRAGRLRLHDSAGGDGLRVPGGEPDERLGGDADRCGRRAVGCGGRSRRRPRGRRGGGPGPAVGYVCRLRGTPVHVCT